MVGSKSSVSSDRERKKLFNRISARAGSRDKVRPFDLGRLEGISRGLDAGDEISCQCFLTATFGRGDFVGKKTWSHKCTQSFKEH